MAFRLIILMLPFLVFAKDYYKEPWGKGSQLSKKHRAKEELTEKSTGAKIANKIIVFYQSNISPANGPKSNFRPTSSRYMENAIKRYGFFKGFIMGCDRLMRENSDPWVYRTIRIDGVDYKFDPATEEKSLPKKY